MTTRTKNTLSVKIKTIWQGQVGLRDKYIKKVRDGGYDLEIRHEDKVMTIPNNLLEKKIHARSEKPFYDRFSGNEHYLLYFLWQPDIDPPTLFD